MSLPLQRPPGSFGLGNGELCTQMADIPYTSLSSISSSIKRLVYRRRRDNELAHYQDLQRKDVNRYGKSEIVVIGRDLTVD